MVSISGDLSDFSVIGPVLNGYAAKAIRGVMTNLDYGLALAFQVNPMEIEFDKEVNYDLDTPVGYNGPIITWVGNGPRKIRLNLFYDATQAAVDSGLAVLGVPTVRTSPTTPLQITPGNLPVPTRGSLGAPPLLGVRGIISVIESFLEPAQPFSEPFGIRSIQARSPPSCILILGLRWWLTQLLSAPMKEILHDKLLTPLRMTVGLEFLVRESGEIQDANLLTRRALAAAESTAGFAASAFTVF